MGLGCHRQESWWRESHRHVNHPLLPRGVWGGAVFCAKQAFNMSLTLAVKLGGFVCQKQSGTTKRLVFSYYFTIQISCAHEFHSRAGSSERIPEQGPVRLQPGTTAVRDAMPNMLHQARGEGCQPGTVKTTLKLSPFFFCPSFISQDVLTSEVFMVALEIEWFSVGMKMLFAKISCEKVTVNCQQFLYCALQSQIPERWLKPRTTPADTWGKSLMVSCKLQFRMLATHQSTLAHSWPIKAQEQAFHVFLH